MVNLFNKKTEYLLSFAIGIVLIIIVNQLGSMYFTRIDLTEEKRYTISDATIEMLQNLDETVYVDVYLDGEFPAGFQRLQKSIREILEEFKVYAGDQLQYQFIDPTLDISPNVRQEFYQNLAEKGIQPTNVFDTKGGEKVEKLVFPGAVISYGTREKGVMLLKGNKSSSPQEQLNQSIEGLEYELASSILQLTQSRLKSIAYLTGHDEPTGKKIAGLKSALSEYYFIQEVDISTVNSLEGFDAFILAQPKSGFSETDKLKMDQFIMKGGKALFVIDKLYVNLDSIGGEGTYALPYDHNLDDFFFKYGIRFEQSLIVDINAGYYPVVVGNMGNQPQMRLMPFPYFPLINRYEPHPIVRNLDAVYTRFVSKIDTVYADGIRKTPLLYTSEYSRIVNAPILVSLNDIRAELKPEFIQAGPQVIGWLYEGAFSSIYKNRFLPEGADQSNFVADGKETGLIFISDGDLIKNEVNPKTGQPLELGLEPFSNTMYANKDLIVNAMAYLMDEGGIINARNREVKIRPLDPVKLQRGKTFWQTFNLVAPIALLIAFGLIKYWIRKKTYAKN
ncbi:MAG TPA: gliding motility-associated ABC transporter substrate-binding protein GldG [Cytophagales bacterium]|nr:gliding motility-associated ABC transporter substrate-binding protein GldG [Cytophagales bacterium]